MYFDVNESIVIHYFYRNHSGAIQSYLEGQLATSILINSPNEYKHWLLALVSHLMQQGKLNLIKIKY